MQISHLLDFNYLQNTMLINILNGKFMNDIILTEIKNGVGFITLNSPKSLNSISLEMANALIAQLKEWNNNKDVYCLFLQGNDKAFCAGGDVRRLYEVLKNNSSEKVAPLALEFFTQEYTLDYMIHTYKKPIMAWGHGIVMGGGIGIYYGASHRIVTEKSILAMPEITIGLYPDVGGTWFLNRMPDNWGHYLGLTGARINAGDALFLGIADNYIESHLKEHFVNQLTSQTWKQDPEVNKKIIDRLIKAETAENINVHSPIKEHKAFASKLSKIESVLEFKSLLQVESLQDEWLSLGYLSFTKGSPTSAMVIFEQLRRGKNLSLQQVFTSELNLSVHFSNSPDFIEGIRALLIDKDQQPKWQPRTLEEVTLSQIESFFAPLWNNENHPLSFLEE